MPEYNFYNVSPDKIKILLDYFDNDVVLPYKLNSIAFDEPILTIKRNNI